MYEGGAYISGRGLYSEVYGIYILSSWEKITFEFLQSR